LKTTSSPNEHGTTETVTISGEAWATSVTMLRTWSWHGGECIDGVRGGQDALTVGERVT
jgi:hypothetical protein